MAIVTVSIFLHLPHTDTSHFLTKLKRVDGIGAVTLVITVFALLIGLDHGGNVSWSDRITIMSFAISVVAFIVFMVVELRVAKEPFAPKHIIMNPSLVACNLCIFFGTGGIFLLIFQIPLYMQVVQSSTAAEAGLALVPSSVGSVVGGVLGGLIMQSLGQYYWLCIVLHFISWAGSVLVAVVTGSAHFYLVLLGLGERIFVPFYSPLTSL